MSKYSWFPKETGEKEYLSKPSVVAVATAACVKSETDRNQGSTTRKSTKEFFFFFLKKNVLSTLLFTPYVCKIWFLVCIWGLWNEKWKMKNENKRERHELQKCVWMGILQPERQPYNQSYSCYTREVKWKASGVGQ